MAPRPTRTQKSSIQTKSFKTSRGPSHPLALKSDSIKRKSKHESESNSLASSQSSPKKIRTNEINPFPSRQIQKCNVFVFGAGSMGELGLGSTSRDRNVKRPRLNPHLSIDGVGIVDVAVGGMHVAALDYKGQVWTWGVNDQGSLGRDTKVNDVVMKDADDESDDEEELLNPEESKPGLVIGFPSGVKIVKLACGDSISVALADDGKVYSWGTFRVPSIVNKTNLRRQMGYWAILNPL
jgi:regulator of chromosome condensation